MATVFKNVRERSTTEKYRLVSHLFVVNKVFEKFVNNSLLILYRNVVFFLIFSMVLDLMTVISNRIARDFNRSGATRAVALDIIHGCGQDFTC